MGMSITRYESYGIKREWWSRTLAGACLRFLYLALATLVISGERLIERLLTNVMRKCEKD